VFFAAGAVQQLGIVTATVINTGLLTALYVVATPFAFWAIERRAPSASISFAVALAFLGIWALGGGSFGALSRGDVLVAVAALMWGIHIVVTGRAGRAAQPLTYTFVQFVVVAALALSLAVAFEPISVCSIVAAADSILYVGLLSSAVTYALMAIALQHIPAPRASILLSAEVLFSAAAGYLLLGERLPPLGWAGAALILAAVLLVRLRS
jgi:drug/metabolite transporter (DMT)-like permease